MVLVRIVFPLPASTCTPSLPLDGMLLPLIVLPLPRCLRCQEQAEGMAYCFYVGHGQGLECRVIRKETAFPAPACCKGFTGPSYFSMLPVAFRYDELLGVLRDSWPAGGCEARRSRRPGPMIVKTVNFLSRKRLRRNRARIVGESDRKPESAQSRASASE